MDGEEKQGSGKESGGDVEKAGGEVVKTPLSAEPGPHTPTAPSQQQKCQQKFNHNPQQQQLRVMMPDGEYRY